MVVAVVAGAVTAGLLGDRLGIVPVLGWQGVGYVVAGALVLLRRLPVPAADHHPQDPIQANAAADAGSTTPSVP